MVLNGPEWSLPDLEENAIICIDGIEQLQAEQLERLQQKLSLMTQQGLAILLMYTSQKHTLLSCSTTTEPTLH